MILKDDGCGITKRSLEFFWANREKIGRITKIKMLDYENEQYPFRLMDNRGNEI